MVGGGFSRYSTDNLWLVPHFEKMLYDNALLLELLALAHQRSGNPLFRTRAQETVDWLAREMTTEEGLRLARRRFLKARRGSSHVWTLKEIEVAASAPRMPGSLARHYDVTAEGNFEGHTILNRLARVPATPEEEARLRRATRPPPPERAKRVRPAFDARARLTERAG